MLGFKIHTEQHISDQMSQVFIDKGTLAGPKAIQVDFGL
jgi:hypothetical protein